MRLERETVVVLLLIALVLVPMWYFALSSATSSPEVVLDQANATIAPTETFLPTPASVDEYVAGVIVWVALFVLVAMLFYTHRFVRTIGQEGPSRAGPSTSGTTTDDGPAAADGGTGTPAPAGGDGPRRGEDGPTAPPLPWYLSTAYRHVLGYWPARYSTPGMVALVLFAWASVSFAGLFGLEALTWSRRQYLGVYGGMMFLSLGVLVAVYTTWFVPSVLVVEAVDTAASGGDDEGEHP